MITDLIIPAYNEEDSIAKVIQEVPAHLVREIIVCNNASTDQTAQRARAAGATVIDASKPGYGSACLAGLAYIDQKREHPDVVAFVDGDLSDYPAQLNRLLDAVTEGNELVIGSRALGERETGAMLPHQVFGNWLATSLIRWIWRVNFTDLGPFRAVRYDALQRIGMNDPDFGWTVEMQVKAARLGLRTSEVAVDYRRRRYGTSKVSGNLKNSYLAGKKILYTIFVNR